VNREQTVALCRYVKACCPQQAIDEYTPDAWHDLIGDLRFEDCREAVRAIAGRQPFVAPAEIKTEVKQIRAQRLDGFQYVPVSGDENTAVYLKNLREQRAAVADGLREPAPAIEPADPERAAQVRKMLGTAFQRPPKADR
jgi:hypothetical protein